MNPLRLRATNYRTFPSLDLTFEHGLVGILGELRDNPEGADSNGAGKSSILEAIDIALFGRRSLAGLLTRGGEATDLMLELTFEHGGSWYRVRRSYSARTKAGKTTVDFERSGYAEEEHGVHYTEQAPVVYEPLTCSSTKETDALIVETIGLSRDTFRNSSYLRQGDGSYADPARDPKQRKDLLAEAALGRDPVWPKAVEQAKNARRAAETNLVRIAGESRNARELVDTRPDVESDHKIAVTNETTLTTAHAAAELELTAAIDRYQAAKEAGARRLQVETELAGAKGIVEALNERTRNADAAARAIVEANTRLSELGSAPDTDRLEQRIVELQAAVEAHERGAMEHQLATQEAAAAMRRQKELLDRSGELKAKAEQLRQHALAILEQHEDARRCDHCGQALGAEAMQTAAASAQREAAELLAQADALGAEHAAIVIPEVPAKPEGEAPVRDLETVRGQLRSAEKAAQERATLAERIAQLQNTAASGPSPDETVAAIDVVNVKRAELDDLEPVNLAALEAAGATARSTVAIRREELDKAREHRARLDERIAAILKAEAQLQAASLQEAELQAYVDVETVIERACGRDGIPALILENRVIPQLEVEATRILAELGTSYRVELRTQAALKDGTGLRDTLEVVVLDETGEAPYDDFSGGEQTRIGLALRIALAKLLAHRRGAESRLLALDEPSYLDAAGMTALLGVLRGLQDEFSTILLVSHVPELRDSLDDAIVVVKDGGRSSIAGPDTTEEWVEEIAA